MTNLSQALDEIRDGLSSGMIAPYLGPGVLELVPACPVPSSPGALAEKLVAKVTVPHKIRKNVTAAAQFIENFKHRKTLTGLLAEAFRPNVAPTPLHYYLASLTKKPLLIVDVWYDNAMETALRDTNGLSTRAAGDVECPATEWGQVQGVSQAEHFGEWTHYFHSDGTPADEAEGESWPTVLYKPLGGISPAANFLVSDSDFVEVLTEIDIQTPIPEVVKHLRTGSHFLFLGCRFGNQLERTFARQIIKRSSDKHWAVLPGELTRNEARFLEEQGIQRIDMPLAEFVASLVGTVQEEVLSAA